MTAHEWQRRMRESTDAELDDRLTRIDLALRGMDMRRASLEDEAALLQAEVARRASRRRAGSPP